MEGVVPGGGQIVGELLDPRLVRDGWERVRSARVGLGRVLIVSTVYLVKVLRLGVVGLDLLVRDRPRGRDPVVVPELPEVLLSQTVERCAVELRRPTHEVVDLRLEGLALVVVPRVLGDVAVVDEDILRQTVLRLAGEPVAALQQQDPLARRREVACKRAAAGTGSDDDHVIGVHCLLPCALRWAGSGRGTASSDWSVEVSGFVIDSSDFRGRRPCACATETNSGDPVAQGRCSAWLPTAVLTAFSFRPVQCR
jgi:hypothetical protein